MPQNSETPLERLRAQLLSAAPNIIGYIFGDLANKLLGGSPKRSHGSLRVFNDPIWKVFEVTKIAQALIEYPLLQRLKYVRQLGLVHHVYPGANHTRFEHSLGAMCAASKMFDQLTANVNLGDEKEGLRTIVLLAALLHDTGHPNFSHVGERVLQNTFPEEFKNIETILQETFPDDVKMPAEDIAQDKSAPFKRERSKLPPAAEIMSVLFVLSPAMEQFFRDEAIPNVSREQGILAISALILGKPFKLLESNNKYNYFIKCIISGDLDCDKIDYVARDAYYAGIPTATDIDRLLTQISVVEAHESTNAPQLEYDFGGGNPSTIRLFGIKPSATSALEMFVMTRAYLFERMYAHPKVRAAEHQLQRLMVQRVQHGIDQEGWGTVEVFDFLYDIGGDDLLLGRLRLQAELMKDCGDPDIVEPAIFFGHGAEKILTRSFPAKAFAFSQKSFQLLSGTSDLPYLVGAYNGAEDELDVNNRKFEKDICALVGVAPGTDVYVNYYLPNPVREDPNIWVTDLVENDTVRRVSWYFSVEQLANAYRSTKQVAWVFSSKDKAIEVAAATSVVLANEFDLIPDTYAYNCTKVKVRDVHLALDQIGENFPQHKALVDNIKCQTEKRVCMPTVQALEPYLAPIEDRADLLKASTLLSQKLSAAQISRFHYDHLETALGVMRILLEHCAAYYDHPKFSRSKAGHNEDRFQKSVMAFCTSLARSTQQFDLAEGTVAGRGKTDIIFTPRGGKAGRPPVVVELKSVPDDYKKIVEENAGQAPQYATTRNCRISILYVQFESKAAVRLADTVDVRAVEGDEAGKMLIICLGQRAFGNVPSKLGKTSKPIQ